MAHLGNSRATELTEKLGIGWNDRGKLGWLRVECQLTDARSILLFEIVLDEIAYAGNLTSW